MSANTKPLIGVLAIQGAVEAHVKHLKSLGINSLLVKSSDQLDKIDGLILPGGESTTMLNQAKAFELWQPLINFSKSKPCFGVCAGAILLSSKTLNPIQDCLEAAPIKATRNAYGRQLESSIETITLNEKYFNEHKAEAVFIRAPKLESLKSDVEALAWLGAEPVLFKYKNILLGSFHPELSESSYMHEFFVRTLV